MWLLLVVFMVHDFEEIIMMRPWFRKNEGYIKARFPRLAPRLLSHASLSTPAFALAVLSEFIILSAAILASVELGLYSLWAGILVAFTVHLVIHIASFVVLRRYVPYIITSVLAMVYSIYAFIVFKNAGLFVITDALVWTVILLIVMGANLFLMFNVGERFDRWMERWSTLD